MTDLDGWVDVDLDGGVVDGRTGLLDGCQEGLPDQEGDVGPAEARGALGEPGQQLCTAVRSSDAQDLTTCLSADLFLTLGSSIIDVASGIAKRDAAFLGIALHGPCYWTFFFDQVTMKMDKNPFGSGPRAPGSR